MAKPYRNSRSLKHYLLNAEVGDTYAHTRPIDGEILLSEVNTYRQDSSARVQAVIYRAGLTGRFTMSTEIVSMRHGDVVAVTVLMRMA